MEKEEKLIATIYKMGCTTTLKELMGAVNDYFKIKGVDTLSRQEVVDISNSVKEKVESGEIRFPDELLGSVVQLLK